MASVEERTARIDDGHLLAKDEHHLRKLRVAAQFANGLLALPNGKHIARIVLYGSLARGEAEPDSDIDVLVFAAQQPAAVEQSAAQLAWELSLKEGEHIAPLVFPLNDFYHHTDFFFTASLREGKEVYAMDEQEIRRNTARNNYLLALDYIEAAEMVRDAGKVRAAIDHAYNAAELIAKAFLALEVETLPTRHGRIIGQFSEVFIIQKQLIPPELGRALNTTLDRRHKARYVWEAELTDEMAAASIKLARDLTERLRQYLVDAADTTAENTNE